ncbi:MAG: adenosylcobinamide-phosphate synthase CbiB [Desulfococcaceae bacterium]
MTPVALPLAFVLDLLIGDPDFRHHPIRYMGRAIEGLEPRFRRLPVSPMVAGGLMAGLLIAWTWAVVVLLLALAEVAHPSLATALEVVLIYFGISCGALRCAALAVLQPLRRGNLPEAREKLAMIVGRDVRNLDETGAARAAVETVAENLVDGVIAPLFFAAIGGAPLLMAYKMVNTLDSMIGYKNDQYREFGRIAAKIDDAANFIPARLSVAFIALAAHILNRRKEESLTIARRDGRRHASPNAGYPEAAFAGALEVRLGGPNIYHGNLVEKPWIGEEFGPVRPSHIPRATDLMVLSAALWVAALTGIVAVIPPFFG